MKSNAWKAVAFVAGMGLVLIPYLLRSETGDRSGASAQGSRGPKVSNMKPASDERQGRMETEMEVFSMAEQRLIRVARIRKTEVEWKETLAPDVYRITREGGTECAFTGKLYAHKGEGLYRCICCATDLFVSKDKFESGTGWPSFFQPVHTNNLRQIVDRSHGMVRTEVRCARCDAHLGHVFEDGPQPTGLRFCINAAALKFEAFPQQP